MNVEKIARDEPQIGRSWDGYLGIAPDNHRMRVMTGMTPAPEMGLAQAHEGQHVIEAFVQPAAAEGGAVRALMPMSIAGCVDRPVDQKGGNTPPTTPSKIGEATAGREKENPRAEVRESRAVAAAHQRLQRRPRNPTAVPAFLDVLLESFPVERRSGCRCVGAPIHVPPRSPVSALHAVLRKRASGIAM